jgi:hypothetical protein
LTIDASSAGFTTAFEALLGRMDAESFGDLPTLSPQAARAKRQSIVGLSTAPADNARNLFFSP